MKILSWNIRGLNSCHKQDIVCYFARDHKSNILLIQETKMPKERVEKLKFFKFCESLGSSFDGASGVLFLYGIHTLFRVCLFVMMTTMFLLCLSILEMVTHGFYLICMRLEPGFLEGNFGLNFLPFGVTILTLFGLLLDILTLLSRRMRSLGDLRYNWTISKTWQTSSMISVL